MFFPANLPYEKWPHVSGVFTLMQSGDWAAVQAYYDDPANKTNIQDSIGAGNYWYNQYHVGIPVDKVGDLIAGAVGIDFDYKPGRVSAFLCVGNASGNASGSVNEGGAGLYGGVVDSLSGITTASFTTWGAKAVQGLAIKPGQYLILYSEAATELGGRADIRSL